MLEETQTNTVQRRSEMKTIEELNEMVSRGESVSYDKEGSGLDDTLDAIIKTVFSQQEQIKELQMVVDEHTHTEFSTYGKPPKWVDPILPTDSRPNNMPHFYCWTCKKPFEGEDSCQCKRSIEDCKINR